MSGSQMSSAANLYQSVINDVITSVRESFLDESVDENVLLELKNLWVQVGEFVMLWDLLFTDISFTRSWRRAKRSSRRTRRMRRRWIPKWRERGRGSGGAGARASTW